MPGTLHSSFFLIICQPAHHLHFVTRGLPIETFKNLRDFSGLDGLSVWTVREKNEKPQINVGAVQLQHCALHRFPNGTVRVCNLWNSLPEAVVITLVDDDWILLNTWGWLVCWASSPDYDKHLSYPAIHWWKGASGLYCSAWGLWFSRQWWGVGVLVYFDSYQGPSHLVVRVGSRTWFFPILRARSTCSWGGRSPFWRLL